MKTLVGHTDDSKIWDLLKTSWKCQEEAKNSSYQTENDGASAMVTQRVHHNWECQNMSTHEKDEAKKLCNSEDFTTPRTEQDFRSISHIVDLRVSQFELADDISSVGCHRSNTNDYDTATAGISTGWYYPGSNSDSLDLRDQSQDCHRRRKWENTQGNRLSDHHYGPVSISWVWSLETIEQCIRIAQFLSANHN